MIVRDQDGVFYNVPDRLLGVLEPTPNDIELSLESQHYEYEAPSSDWHNDNWQQWENFQQSWNNR